ncbi:hypothetical protein Lalb_Chr22g0349911 [Lupinus albus]|uniref:Uncharacterized protein n=1 Tax=Lupinus albus TaxID=3870 RepID=A0A6A4NMW6_LUPAL|nr:hypothetical protein Lalb_Chr22g0349911 [Lupinus albus]
MEEAMTDSLERSLQNCSLNNNQTEKEEDNDDVLIVDNHHHHQVSNSDTTLDLNSHLSLPYHWEQCLDLKGESILQF